MCEKRNLRKQLREMEVGQTITIPREEYLPSTVKSSVYTVKADYGRNYTIRTRGVDGVEVSRIS